MGDGATEEDVRCAESSLRIKLDEGLSLAQEETIAESGTRLAYDVTANAQNGIIYGYRASWSDDARAPARHKQLARIIKLAASFPVRLRLKCRGNSSPTLLLAREWLPGS